MFRLALLMALLVAPAWAGSKHNDDQVQASQIEVGSDLEYVAARSRESTVIVATETGHGTGTYFKWHGHTFVLTAAHVVESKNVTLVYATPDGMTNFSAGTVIWKDDERDEAIISANIDLRPIEFRQSNGLADVGERVVTSGYPSIYDKLVMRGEVAGYMQDGDNTFIICSGFAWPGMSGGSYFDEYGHVIGTITAVGVGRTDLGAQLIPDLVWVSPMLITDDELREIFSKRW